MNTFGIIFISLLLSIFGIFITSKVFNDFKDDDDDCIKKIESEANEIVKTIDTTKERVKIVKQETQDVVDAANEIIKQSIEIIESVKNHNDQ